ncbi:microtubule-associated protein futsch [Hyalella azteca]|uniref:Microtubule-associated protein futsch n=1 Tax=Hyalella azteca TaxID=294128 RepID=A0A979FXG2_HYAAZ|nr:microtubule-associated protein futsch [Hyalella azteca]
MADPPHPEPPPPVSPTPPAAATAAARGEGALSPLSGCYLLIVVSDPQSNRHKDTILSKITKGFLSWDEEKSHLDIHKELKLLAELNLEGEEQKGGERLVQYANEHMVVEVLINPQVNTVQQCLKNLLSSFTKHRHIIHAGYAFAGSGSWMLQDGTFSVADLFAAFNEYEVQRVLHAYESCISIDIHCAGEGKWTTEAMSQEYFSKQCQVTVNPGDKIAVTDGITAIVEYISKLLIVQDVESIHEPSDIVGNIRFTRPTLYVFPGGQGDSALFGVNGFNMLVDGGYNRKGCFWDFTRHLDRLDAVLVTRLNSSNVMGIANVIRRKAISSVYPQIGHIFCNVAGTKSSPDGGKDEDTLLINIWDEGHLIRENLRQLSLKPHLCFRDNVMDPINLYHKVGHGKLDMYVLNPSKDSKDVQYFMERWNNDVRTSDVESCTYTIGNKVFPCPLMNVNSICALVVWQPNDPTDTITRILFPGSTPQHKVFEGLEKLKHLEYLKYPRCSAKSLRLKNEEKRSSRLERLTSTQKVSRISSQITTLSTKSERVSRSVSKEEKRRTRVEKTVSESKTGKTSEIRPERVRRKKRKEIGDEPKEKAYSELQETTIDKEIGELESEEGPGRPESLRDASPEKITDNKLQESPPLAVDEVTEVPNEEIDQTEEVRESSMLSVESGIILADDRESSLEIEQTKRIEEPVIEKAPAKEVISEKEKENEKIKKKLPPQTVEKVKVSKRPRVQPRIDTGSGRVDTKYRQENRVERIRKESKLKKEEPVPSQKLEPESEVAPVDNRTIGKVVRKTKKPTSTEVDHQTGELDVKEVKKTSTKRVEKRQVETKSMKSSTEKQTTVKMISEKSRKREAEEKNVAAKAAREEAKKRSAIKPLPKVSPKKKRPETTPSKSSEPVKKIITGAAMKAGVVAAAAAGIIVPDNTMSMDHEEKGIRDEEDILLPVKDDNLGPDNDEEDRISDIANIPGVQELKIEDEYSNVTDRELLEEEEKDSLILHEEGVIEQVEREEISDIIEEDDDRDEIKYQEEKRSENDEQNRSSPRTRETQPESASKEDKRFHGVMAEELPDTALRLQEKEEISQEVLKSLEKEDDVKAEVSLKTGSYKMDLVEDSKTRIIPENILSKQKLKDVQAVDAATKISRPEEAVDNEIDKDDAYATLPSSAKLTDYKDKYEEKPVRGLFGSFETIQRADEEMWEKRTAETGEHKELPSSLPVITEKSTKPYLQPRDVIKTPDEVDELPIHEEVIESMLEDVPELLDDRSEHENTLITEKTTRECGLAFEKTGAADAEAAEEASLEYDLLERVTLADDPNAYPKHFDINIHRASIVADGSETEEREPVDVEEKGSVEKMEKELQSLTEEDSEKNLDEVNTEKQPYSDLTKKITDDALSPKEKLFSIDTLLEKEADSTENDSQKVAHKKEFDNVDVEIPAHSKVSHQFQTPVETVTREKVKQSEAAVLPTPELDRVLPRDSSENSYQLDKQSDVISPRPSEETKSPVPIADRYSPEIDSIHVSPKSDEGAETEPAAQFSRQLRTKDEDGKQVILGAIKSDEIEEVSEVITVRTERSETTNEFTESAKEISKRSTISVTEGSHDVAVIEEKSDLLIVENVPTVLKSYELPYESPKSLITKQTDSEKPSFQTDDKGTEESTDEKSRPEDDETVLDESDAKLREVPTEQEEERKPEPAEQVSPKSEEETYSEEKILRDAREKPQDEKEVGDEDNEFSKVSRPVSISKVSTDATEIKSEITSSEITSVTVSETIEETSEVTESHDVVTSASMITPKSDKSPSSVLPKFIADEPEVTAKASPKQDESVSPRDLSGKSDQLDMQSDVVSSKPSEETKSLVPTADQLSPKVDTIDFSSKLEGGGKEPATQISPQLSPEEKDEKSSAKIEDISPVVPEDTQSDGIEEGVSEVCTVSAEGMESTTEIIESSQEISKRSTASVADVSHDVTVIKEKCDVLDVGDVRTALKSYESPTELPKSPVTKESDSEKHTFQTDDEGTKPPIDERTRPEKDEAVIDESDAKLREVLTKPIDERKPEPAKQVSPESVEEIYSEDKILTDTDTCEKHKDGEEVGEEDNEFSEVSKPVSGASTEANEIESEIILSEITSVTLSKTIEETSEVTESHDVDSDALMITPKSDKSPSTITPKSIVDKPEVTAKASPKQDESVSPRDSSEKSDQLDMQSDVSSKPSEETKSPVPTADQLSPKADTIDFSQKPDDGGEKEPAAQISPQLSTDDKDEKSSAKIEDISPKVPGDAQSDGIEEGVSEVRTVRAERVETKTENIESSKEISKLSTSSVTEVSHEATVIEGICDVMDVGEVQTVPKSYESPSQSPTSPVTKQTDSEKSSFQAADKSTKEPTDERSRPKDDKEVIEESDAKLKEELTKPKDERQPEPPKQVTPKSAEETYSEEKMLMDTDIKEKPKDDKEVGEEENEFSEVSKPARKVSTEATEIRSEIISSEITSITVSKTIEETSEVTESHDVASSASIITPKSDKSPSSISPKSIVDEPEVPAKASPKQDESVSPRGSPEKSDQLDMQSDVVSSKPSEETKSQVPTDQLSPTVDTIDFEPKPDEGVKKEPAVQISPQLSTENQDENSSTKIEDISPVVPGDTQSDEIEEGVSEVRTVRAERVETITEIIESSQEISKRSTASVTEVSHDDKVIEEKCEVLDFGDVQTVSKSYESPTETPKSPVTKQTDLAKPSFQTDDEGIKPPIDDRSRPEDDEADIEKSETKLREVLTKPEDERKPEPTTQVSPAEFSNVSKPASKVRTDATEIISSEITSVIVSKTIEETSEVTESYVVSDASMITPKSEQSPSSISPRSTVDEPEVTTKASQKQDENVSPRDSSEKSDQLEMQSDVGSAKPTEETKSPVPTADQFSPEVDSIHFSPKPDEGSEEEPAAQFSPQLSTEDKDEKSSPKIKDISGVPPEDIKSDEIEHGVSEICTVKAGRLETSTEIFELSKEISKRSFTSVTEVSLDASVIKDRSKTLTVGDEEQTFLTSYESHSVSPKSPITKPADSEKPSFEPDDRDNKEPTDERSRPTDDETVMEELDTKLGEVSPKPEGERKPELTKQISSKSGEEPCLEEKILKNKDTREKPQDDDEVGEEDHEFYEISKPVSKVTAGATEIISSESTSFTVSETIDETAEVTESHVVVTDSSVITTESDKSPASISPKSLVGEPEVAAKSSPKQDEIVSPRDASEKSDTLDKQSDVVAPKRSEETKTAVPTADQLSPKVDSIPLSPKSDEGGETDPAAQLSPKLSTEDKDEKSSLKIKDISPVVPEDIQSHEIDEDVSEIRTVKAERLETTTKIAESSQEISKRTTTSETGVSHDVTIIEEEHSVITIGDVQAIHEAYESTTESPKFPVTKQTDSEKPSFQTDDESTKQSINEISRTEDDEAILEESDTKLREVLHKPEEDRKPEPTKQVSPKLEEEPYSEEKILQDTDTKEKPQDDKEVIEEDNGFLEVSKQISEVSTEATEIQSETISSDITSVAVSKTIEETSEVTESHVVVTDVSMITHKSDKLPSSISPKSIVDEPEVTAQASPKQDESVSPSDSSEKSDQLDMQSDVVSTKPSDETKSPIPTEDQRSPKVDTIRISPKPYEGGETEPAALISPQFSTEDVEEKSSRKIRDISSVLSEDIQSDEIDEDVLEIRTVRAEKLETTTKIIESSKTISKRSTTSETDILNVGDIQTILKSPESPSESPKSPITKPTDSEKPSFQPDDKGTKEPTDVRSRPAAVIAESDTKLGEVSPKREEESKPELTKQLSPKSVREPYSEEKILKDTDTREKSQDYDEVGEEDYEFPGISKPVSKVTTDATEIISSEITSVTVSKIIEETSEITKSLVAVAGTSMITPKSDKSPSSFSPKSLVDEPEVAEKSSPKQGASVSLRDSSENSDQVEMQSDVVSPKPNEVIRSPVSTAYQLSPKVDSIQVSPKPDEGGETEPTAQISPQLSAEDKDEKSSPKLKGILPVVPGDIQTDEIDDVLEVRTARADRLETAIDRIESSKEISKRSTAYVTEVSHDFTVIEEKSDALNVGDVQTIYKPYESPSETPTDAPLTTKSDKSPPVCRKSLDEEDKVSRVPSPKPMICVSPEDSSKKSEHLDHHPAGVSSRHIEDTKSPIPVTDDHSPKTDFVISHKMEPPSSFSSKCEETDESNVSHTDVHTTDLPELMRLVELEKQVIATHSKKINSVAEIDMEVGNSEKSQVNSSLYPKEDMQESEDLNSTTGQKETTVSEKTGSIFSALKVDVTISPSKFLSQFEPKVQGESKGSDLLMIDERFAAETALDSSAEGNDDVEVPTAKHKITSTLSKKPSTSGDIAQPVFAVLQAQKAEFVHVSADTTPGSTPMSPKSTLSQSIILDKELTECKSDEEKESQDVKEVSFVIKTSTTSQLDDIMSSSMYGDDFASYGLLESQDTSTIKTSSTEVKEDIMSTSMYGQLLGDEISTEETHSEQGIKAEANQFELVEEIIDSGRPRSPKIVSAPTESVTLITDKSGSTESFKLQIELGDFPKDESRVHTSRSDVSEKDSAFDDRDKAFSLESQGLSPLTEDTRTYVKSETSIRECTVTSQKIDSVKRQELSFESPQELTSSSRESLSYSNVTPSFDASATPSSSDVSSDEGKENSLSERYKRKKLAKHSEEKKSVRKIEHAMSVPSEMLSSVRPKTGSLSSRYITTSGTNLQTTGFSSEFDDNFENISHKTTTTKTVRYTPTVVTKVSTVRRRISDKDESTSLGYSQSQQHHEEISMRETSHRDISLEIHSQEKQRDLVCDMKIAQISGCIEDGSQMEQIPDPLPVQGCIEDDLTSLSNVHVLESISLRTTRGAIEKFETSKSPDEALEAKLMSEVFDSRAAEKVAVLSEKQISSEVSGISTKSSNLADTMQSTQQKSMHSQEILEKSAQKSQISSTESHESESGKTVLQKKSSSGSTDTPVTGSPRTGRVVVRRVTTVITKYYEDGEEVEMEEVPGSETVEVLGDQEISAGLLRKISSSTSSPVATRKKTDSPSHGKSFVERTVSEPWAAEKPSVESGDSCFVTRSIQSIIREGDTEKTSTDGNVVTTATTKVLPGTSYPASLETSRAELPQTEDRSTIKTSHSTTSSSTSRSSKEQSVVKSSSTVASSFSSSTSENDPKSVLKDWGKPLGLPSPVHSSESPKPRTPPRPRRTGRRIKRPTPVYLDLAYVPHAANPNYCNIDYFRKVRARYYVFSGIDPGREVLDALLQAKIEWEDKNLEVTIIPTYDTDALGYWVAANEDALIANKIDLAPSAVRCTINLQDHETSCNAYRLEF